MQAAASAEPLCCAGGCRNELGLNADTEYQHTSPVPKLKFPGLCYTGERSRPTWTGLCLADPAARQPGAQPGSAVTDSPRWGPWRDAAGPSGVHGAAGTIPAICLPRVGWKACKAGQRCCSFLHLWEGTACGRTGICLTASFLQNGMLSMSGIALAPGGTAAEPFHPQKLNLFGWLHIWLCTTSL